MINIAMLNLQDMQLIRLLKSKKNLSRVADAMFLSQPAASQRIKNIHEKLGIEVAVRFGKRWEMTEAGIELANLYEQIAHFQEDYQIRINDIHKTPRGRLIIGTSDTLGIHLLPGPLEKFSQEYPDIHIEVTSKPSRVIAKELTEGAIDVGIALASAARGNFNKNNLFIRKDCLIVSPDHPLARKTRCRISDLSGLPMILLDPSSQSRATIESWFKQEEIELYHTMEMGSIELIKTYVAHGFGAGIVPRLSVEKEVKTGMLKTLDLPAAYPDQKVVVFTAQNRYEKKISRLFIDFIRSSLNPK